MLTFDPGANRASQPTYHNNTGSLRGTTDSRNSKKLNEAGKEVTVGRDCRCFDEKPLLLKLSVDVVKFAGSLEGRVS